MWHDCTSGESLGARLNCTFLTASMSWQFATCTELGFVVSYTSVQYVSTLLAPNFPEAPLSKIEVACAAI